MLLQLLVVIEVLLWSKVAAAQQVLVSGYNTRLAIFNVSEGQLVPDNEWEVTSSVYFHSERRDV